MGDVAMNHDIKTTVLQDDDYFTRNRSRVKVSQAASREFLEDAPIAGEWISARLLDRLDEELARHDMEVEPDSYYEFALIVRAVPKQRLPNEGNEHDGEY